MRLRSKLVALLLVAVVCLAVCSPAWAQGATPKKGEEFSFFQHYFVEGGPIVWFIELPLSVVILALGITFGMKYRRINLVPIEEVQRIVSMLEARQYRGAIEETSKSTTLTGYALNKAMALAPMGYLVMERALEDAVDEKASTLTSKIEPLNIIGNVGPLIGLFGTVVGMIDTFTTIVGQGGVPDATQLAKGISIALVCTAWGLIIAIPGLATYGWLRNRVERFANEAAVRGQEVLGIFRGGAGRPGGATAAGGAQAVPQSATVPMVEQA
jgi:biopolymer transport protein ExbB